MITIRRTDSANSEFQELVHQLDVYLTKINGAENDFFAQFNKIDQIKNVVVLFKDEVAVGCGAMKEYNYHTMEIKRMFIPLEQRGKGFATTILQELELWAKELGYKKCILETGNQMLDAIGLYKKNNFKVIPNYGQYKDVDSSICFEKNI